MLDDEDFSVWLQANWPAKDRRGKRLAQFQSLAPSISSSRPLRNPLVRPPYLKLSAYIVNDVAVRTGSDVEFFDGKYSKYLRVIDIIQLSTTLEEVTLRGWLFDRTSTMSGILERKVNELCWILEIDEDDARDYKVQAMVSIPVSQVVRRRKIRLTNQPYPELSFRKEDMHTDVNNIRRERLLVCRWMYISSYRTSSTRQESSKLWCERSLQRLSAKDCDKWSGFPNQPCAVKGETLRQNWRGSNATANGERRRQGFDLSNPSLPSGRLRSDVSRDGRAIKRKISQVIDLTKNDFSVVNQKPTTSLLEQLLRPKHCKGSVSKSLPKSSNYSFGDCFCGAGGMSRSATLAGLRIVWAFDFEKNACESYLLNFPDVDVRNAWAHEFSGDTATTRTVDICHMSPPCQFFSDAHTKDGKDDETNTASLFAVGQLIEKSKPRVVTLEQTFGILARDRHEAYFNSLLQMFTSKGFSVRWKLIHCADFGVPQMRLRTFIIASCPGEPLPPFPKPTHSSEPLATGLKPWTTINQAINRIPPGFSDHHNPEEVCKRSDLPTDGNKIANTVTTGGGIVHSSGLRDYTNREFACIQSFPLEHRFGKAGVKKQIGNAVPPLVGYPILVEIVKSLKKTDGLY